VDYYLHGVWILYLFIISIKMIADKIKRLEESGFVVKDIKRNNSTCEYEYLVCDRKQ